MTKEQWAQGNELINSIGELEKCLKNWKSWMNEEAHYFSPDARLKLFSLGVRDIEEQIVVLKKKLEGL